VSFSDSLYRIVKKTPEEKIIKGAKVFPNKGRKGDVIGWLEDFLGCWKEKLRS
jgi:hypothetical protein